MDRLSVWRAAAQDVGFDVGRLTSVGLEIDVERGDGAKSWRKRRRAGRLPLGGNKIYFQGN
jgi:hypothetical protein